MRESGPQYDQGRLQGLLLTYGIPGRDLQDYLRGYVYQSSTYWEHINEDLFKSYDSQGTSLIVLATLRGGYVLLALGGLGFVGLGAQPPAPEWGALLASGRTQMDGAPWLAVFPGLAITLTVAAVNLFGDGLNDWRERRMRA